MSRGWRIAIAAAAAIIVPGGIYAAVSLSLLTKISYSIYGFKIKSIDPKYVSFEIILEVKNPAKVSVTIEGYDIGVGLNGFKVARIKNADVKVLKSEQVSYLSIPVKINHQEVFGAVKSGEFLADILLKKYSKIIVSLDGRFLGEVLKVPVSTKIKMKYTMDEILKMKKQNADPGTEKSDIKLII